MFTSVDLVKAYLARIQEVNLNGPALRAVIETNPLALEQAAVLDSERQQRGKRSVLHGIPILLKDNMATLANEGMNTTAGSYALYKSIVPDDATVARKLREAGAILLGKTNMCEWAHVRGRVFSGWSARGGQNTSPYYPGADTCGSSSGSAVATAIGLAAASLGTETDGSIICPASYNNVVGIKPTVGLTSRTGVIPISPPRDTVGPIARSVADAAAILTIIAGRDSTDNYTDSAPVEVPDYMQFLRSDAIKGKRFGVPRAMFLNDTYANDPSISAEFNKALDTIRALGGVVVDPAHLPSADLLARTRGVDGGLVIAIDLKIALNAYFGSLKHIPTNVTTLQNLIYYNNVHKDFEKPKGYEDQSQLLSSDSTTGHNTTYFDALHNEYSLGRERGIDAALEADKLDALLLPGHSRLTPYLAAIAGYPIITVPLGFHHQNTSVRYKPGSNIIYPAPGLPIGISFVGTAYSEPSLIGFAYAYEQHTRTRLKRRAYQDAIPKTQLGGEHIRWPWVEKLINMWPTLAILTTAGS